MRWRAFFLGFCLLLSSPASWSQEPSSSRIVVVSYDNWMRLQQIQTQLADLQRQHELTLKTGSAWLKQTRQELASLQIDYDSLLKDLAKEKKFSGSLLSRMSELEDSLKKVDADLEAARSAALAIELSGHIAWSVDAVAGAGLITWGIYKGDLVLVGAGVVMLIGAGGHFVLALY